LEAKLVSLTRWDILAVGSGAVLAHLALSGPIGWVVGAAAGYVFAYAADPTRHHLAAALAQSARESVGLITGSEAQKALIAHADPRENWCALAVMGWIRRATQRTGKNTTVVGSPGALATMVQFQEALKDGAHWIPANTLRAAPELVKPGMVPVWTRPTDPPGGGHIGIVTRGLDHKGTFQSVEGNAGGNVISYHEHPLDAPNFLGMGQFTT
jgi:hypothetical protein